MTDQDTWQKRNDDYLAAALAKLRQRLSPKPAETAPVQTSVAAAPEPAPPTRKWGFFAGPSSAPAGSGHASDPAVDPHAASTAEPATPSDQTQPPPALEILSQRLGLSPFERDVLFLCAAMELDTRIAGLCAQAQGDPNRPYPTFALALSVLDDPAWDVLSPQRPLRFWRLLEINQPGAQPLTTSALRADERIVNYIKGLNYLDDRLAPLLLPCDTASSDTELPASQQAAVTTIVQHLQQGPPGLRLPVIQLLGCDASSKQLIAQHAAAALGLHLYRLPAGVLPSPAGDLETFARLWQRESILLPIALYLEADDSGASDAHASGLSRLVARSGGVLFLDTHEMSPAVTTESVAVDIDKPTPAEQQSAWAAALGAAGESPATLAGQFNLSLADISRIVRVAHAEAAGQPPDPAVLWQACLMHTRPRLDALAQRLDPKATWTSLVLPSEETELLHSVCAQARQRRTVYEAWGFGERMNRGLGISVLFAGESGTGKTMAAEVIANDLQLNLYRIDLSAVVSKYIGETEKNLRRLFDAAEDGGAILFFDEADALFGKRSEVKDSHDRYANIEINYLLQRMEAYRGLAILATNMKSALDPAFARRLRFIVNFPYPGPAERTLIWQKVFPPQTPAAGLDLDRLARLNLTGGSIHNIALNAAFLAARAGTQVTMPLLLNAARTEFRKLERQVSDGAFRYLEPAGAKA